VARALRAAQQVGGDWEVVIEGKAIRIVPRETTTGVSVTVPPSSVQEEPAAQPDWKF